MSQATRKMWMRRFFSEARRTFPSTFMRMPDRRAIWQRIARYRDLKRRRGLA